jgi:hypothetical protein
MIVVVGVMVWVCVARLLAAAWAAGVAEVGKLLVLPGVMLLNSRTCPRQRDAGLCVRAHPFMHLFVMER